MVTHARRCYPNSTKSLSPVGHQHWVYTGGGGAERHNFPLSSLHLVPTSMNPTQTNTLETHRTAQASTLHSKAVLRAARVCTPHPAHTTLSVLLIPTQAASLPVALLRARGHI